LVEFDILGQALRRPCTPQEQQLPLFAVCHQAEQIINSLTHSTFTS